MQWNATCKPCLPMNAKEDGRNWKSPSVYMVKVSMKNIPKLPHTNRWLTTVQYERSSPNCMEHRAEINGKKTSNQMNHTQLEMLN